MLIKTVLPALAGGAIGFCLAGFGAVMLLSLRRDPLVQSISRECA
jgi:hypothetical protein